MTRQVRLGVAVLIATIGAMVGFANPAVAATITVSPGHSIQAAINAASPGDTITVKSGTYHENLVIKKNNLTIVGQSATLLPPATAFKTPCAPASGPVGFCVAGNSSTSTPVRGDVIRGFAVRNFSTGVMGIGSANLTVFSNVFANNSEYGAAAFNSTGAHFGDNLSIAAGEAGFYLGDSPDAGAVVTGNEAFGGFIGQFVRNAQNIYIAHNYWHDNCVGFVVLADAPGPAGALTAQNNDIDHNTRACPANEESGPVSGVGVALLGAHDVKLLTNVITRNVPSGNSEFAGGVVVGNQGPGSTRPKNNTVKNNTLHNNQPDIFWDRSGTGNSFVGNSCDTSNPSGLC
jgi:hypothetical protein